MRYRNVRNAGVDIWIDPLIQFNHAGNVGCFLETLTEQKPENDKEKNQS